MSTAKRLLFWNLGHISSASLKFSLSHCSQLIECRDAVVDLLLPHLAPDPARIEPFLHQRSDRRTIRDGGTGDGWSEPILVASYSPSGNDRELCSRADKGKINRCAITSLYWCAGTQGDSFDLNIIPI